MSRDSRGDMDKVGGEKLTGITVAMRSMHGMADAWYSEGSAPELSLGRGFLSHEMTSFSMR